MRGWLRRERRALLLLPVALVLVLGATGSRLNEYWWNEGFHQRAEPDADGWVKIRDEYDDGYLRYPIEADVRLRDVQQVDPATLDDVTIADDAVLWRVDTSWRADPDVSMVGCTFALVEGDTVWEGSSFGWNGGTLAFTDRCVPDDTYGPRPTIGSTEKPRVPDDEQPRPATWDKSTYLVTAADAKPTSVRIWYFLPTYAELPVG